MFNTMTMHAEGFTLRANRRAAAGAAAEMAQAPQGRRFNLALSA